jgi:Na+/melibiose symporter-like transporter
VAGVIAMLISEDGAFIAGSEIRLDGGAHIGATLGIFAAGALAAQIPLAYAILVGGSILVTLLFVVVNREQSTVGIPRAPFAWGAFIKGFWINPVNNPDFAWAFAVRVLVLLAFNIPFAFQFFILTDFIQLSVEEANSTIGYLAIISLAATLVGTAFSGWLSDRLNRRKLLIYISVAIMLASYIMPVAMPDLTGITLYWIVNGVGYGIFVAVDAALMMDVLPSEGVDSGKELSILNIATALPTILSAIIASLIITQFGGFNMLFIVAAVLVVLGGIMTVAIKKVK